MPSSQLKRLKASLREQGVTRPQKAKKERKSAGNGATAENRLQRNHALQNIRDNFNPFDIKAAPRPRKFDVTTSQSQQSKNTRVVLGRPGVTKSAGEEARRRLLLPEMQRRNRVGGIVDRRIGENDPAMTPGERALQRFTREKQKRKGNVFDLEDAGDEDQLTHGGQALDFEKGPNAQDDFDEADSGLSGDLSDDSRSGKEAGGLLHKRKRDELEGTAAHGTEQPVQKKSKAEAMKEVIAKSKLYKYERQQAKEDDDDLREQLDKGLPDILAELGSRIPHKSHLSSLPSEVQDREITMNPERAAMLKGASRADVEKRYDEQLRQMAQDRRAAPTERTKTEDEQLVEEAEQLRALEEERLRRMRGDRVEDDGDEKSQSLGPNEDLESEPDDAAHFGFSGLTSSSQNQLVLDDEDEFLLDDNLIANDSEENLDASGDEGWATAEEDPIKEAQEDDFVQGLLSKEELERPDFVGLKASASTTKSKEHLAFTFPCPGSHDELLKVLTDVLPAEVPTVIRRIRTLYHPQLHEDNKTKLAAFSVALVEHISHTTQDGQPLEVVETIIRHVHSLSRTFPEKIANAFRSHLDSFRQKPKPDPGDLSILTAIGSIYPTSDHFHPIVTPAITIIAQWLGLSTITSSPLKTDLNTGAYLVALILSYQSLSHRFIPEALTYTLHALRHSPASSCSLHLTNLTTMANLWHTHPSFPESFRPFLPILADHHHQHHHPPTSDTTSTIQTLIAASLRARRPLQLHHHRPRAIPAATPRFEPGFDPSRHYDADADRAASRRLQREWKRERKGALRELRKDASFVGRERLKEKRRRDEEYERKMRRLVAEVQGGG